MNPIRQKTFFSGGERRGCSEWLGAGAPRRMWVCVFATYTHTHAHLTPTCLSVCLSQDNTDNNGWTRAAGTRERVCQTPVPQPTYFIQHCNFANNKVLRTDKHNLKPTFNILTNLYVNKLKHYNFKVKITCDENKWRLQEVMTDKKR